MAGFASLFPSQTLTNKPFSFFSSLSKQPLKKKTLFSSIMSSFESDPKQHYQHIIVLRHGDRRDNFDKTWTASADRPWDPPLVVDFKDQNGNICDGKVRAFRTGLGIRKVGYPIHRVFVSPFVRCIETAAEAVKAILAVEDIAIDDVSDDWKSDGVVIDSSKIQVSIEYGLCEMLNNIAIRRDVAPKDGIFSFDISKCESMFPAGTVDNTVEPVFKELPKWQESPEAARARYCDIIKALADKYPSENLLLVTHAEGVASAVSVFAKDAGMVYEVDYCAYSQLQRPVAFGENQSFTAGDIIGHPEGQVGMKFKKDVEA